MSKALKQNLIVAVWAVGFFLFLCFVLINSAIARDNGQYAQSDPFIRDWFKSVKNKAGFPCCDISDGHKTEEDRRDGAYWVPINGAWRKVPPEAVIYDAGNPVGQAVVWYSDFANEIHIRCFVPGGGV